MKKIAGINKEVKPVSGNQTAVEWLFEMLIDNKYLIKDATHLFQQAKQMFKEQIIEARIDGDEDYSLIGSKRREYAEQYYNETYGS